MREIDVGKTSETLKCLRMQEGIGEDVEVYRESHLRMVIILLTSAKWYKTSCPALVFILKDKGK